jgi:hypothetical protein
MVAAYADLQKGIRGLQKEPVEISKACLLMTAAAIKFKLVFREILVHFWPPYRVWMPAWLALVAVYFTATGV